MAHFERIMKPTAAEFWHGYREQLRRCGSWQLYQDNIAWTEFAKTAAEQVLREMGMQASREYLRLDVCGYTYRSDDPYDWDLRVAFEVESGAQWKDELCKLAHVVADLRVLVAYESHRKWTAAEALEHYLTTLHDRVLRVPDSQWLFIFGPHWRSPSETWKAYTIDPECRIQPLPDKHPLPGSDMLWTAR